PRTASILTVGSSCCHPGCERSFSKSLIDTEGGQDSLDYAYSERFGSNTGNRGTYTSHTQSNKIPNVNSTD
ncbi:uncharacterized protein METZ01_LOCUS120933, partial [marine metagenome]